MPVQKTAYLLLALSVLFWSGNTIVARLLYDEISAIALSTGRWWLATIILLPFTWRHLKKDFTKLVRHWPIITLLSFLGISLFNTLLYHAAHTTTSTNLALIQTTMPAMIVLLASLLYNERTGILALTGVTLSMLGAILVVTRGDWQVLSSMAFTAGDLWMLLASLVYALYSVLLRKRPDINSLSFLGATFIIGSILLLPLLLWDVIQNPLPALNRLITGSFIYVAIFPSILAYLFWNKGVQMIGASMAGFFICLMPIFTAVLAAVFLDERLLWFHIVGLLMIITGFVLFQRR